MGLGRAARARRPAAPPRRAPRLRGAGSARARTGSRGSREARPRGRAAAAAASDGPRRAPSRRARARARPERPGARRAAMLESASRAGARLAERAVAGEEARRPAKAPDRVVVVLAARPALQHEAAVPVGAVDVALVLRRARRARRRCPRSSRPRRGARPCRGTGRAAAGRPTTRRGTRGSIRECRPPQACRPRWRPGAQLAESSAARSQSPSSRST